MNSIIIDSLLAPNFFTRSFDNKAGSAFFGIDARYLVQIQKREIFDLVSEGWNSETLYKMSIEERRFYYNELVKKYAPKENSPDPRINKSKKM